MVKKCCYIVEVFLLMLILCGCSAYELKEGNTKNSSVEEVQNEEYVDETNVPSKKEEVEFEKIDTGEEPTYLNDCFPYKNNQTVSFAGRLLDYSVEGNVILRFHKEMGGDKGELWQVIIAEIDDPEKSEEDLKTVSSIHDSLHYFFITKDRIYWIEKGKISDIKKKEICNQAELPQDADIVCQDKEKVVNRDGWHYRVVIDEKNFISYSACFKLEQEASYLRNITFKQGVGIVKFSSQTTLAGAESIELWDERFYHSEEYAVIERN